MNGTNEGNIWEVNEGIKLTGVRQRNIVPPVQYNQIPERIWLLAYVFHLLKENKYNKSNLFVYFHILHFHVNSGGIRK